MILSAQASPRDAGERPIVVACFGLEADRARRQPWHTALGLAEGFAQLGRRAVLITDAVDPPTGTLCRVVRVRGMTAKRGLRRERPHPSLGGVIRQLSPERVFLFTGVRGLARMSALPWAQEGVRTTLVMASPRLRPTEVLSLGLGALWRERGVLALPLWGSLLSDGSLRRGYLRSKAHDALYLSRAARDRYARAGLPAGSVMPPPVNPFPDRREGSNSGGPTVTYLGPALATRGADLALGTFERVADDNPNVRLLLLLRPDAGGKVLRRLQRAAAESRHAARIEVDARMLSERGLAARLGEVDLFVLPFRAPVSEAPLVVLEAALSGRPVVALEAPGVAEFVRAWGGRVASSPADLPNALRRALEDSALGARPARPAVPLAWTSWAQAARDVLAGPNPLKPLGFVGLCGVDGSGKTALLHAVRDGLAERGTPSRHVWSRFRNYTSKPLLALARLTGHNRKVQENGVAIGYHDFQRAPWLAYPFVALQLVDLLLDRARYLRRPGQPALVAGDRCLLDTVVDLAVDTELDDLLIDRLAPKLARLLPSPRLVCVVERPRDLVEAQRPDAVAERHFERRRTLYRRLAAALDLPVIVNDGTIGEAAARVLRLAEHDFADPSPVRSSPTPKQASAQAPPPLARPAPALETAP